MAQPMTLIATPDPEPQPQVCNAGVAFCVGTCLDVDGDGYHAADFVPAELGRHNGDDYDAWIATTRTDTKEQIGVARVELLFPGGRNEVVLTPERARRLSALLLNSADDADPMPNGVIVIAASAIRLGDALLTDDGWQNVVGQMVFADQVSVWTDDYDHDPETDGWYFLPADPVKVRRPMYASEPVLNRVERPATSAVGWCARCKADRVINGPRVTSVRGVIRVRGRCQTCNKRGQNAFAGLASWAEGTR